MKNENTHDKIMQLLQNSTFNNKCLGIELLMGTYDKNVLISVLNDQTIFRHISLFPFISYFQKNRNLWHDVSPFLNKKSFEYFLRWMDLEVLSLQGSTYYDFFMLANQQAQKYYGKFPELKENILTNSKDYGVFGGIDFGEKIINGIGWSVELELTYHGPAEIITVLDWSAKTIHPDFSITIKKMNAENGFERAWLIKNP